ncbi:MAG: flagellar motor protein MotB [Rhodoferax sp.]|jgi:chemotaxis protein MotB|nr:flagellar motor protein MotB [Rhodoferax sp.]MBP9928263.1 flagellar motor protein MotB [Rhodoferax sp.]HQX58052.1 flagellar motor protein MotB [Burkholderiaceae bacterium]HQZ07814.1 flagellar motor protein MotB [Burkholderiaceae bacterium]HRA64031.1 flagellar motor protein MotB [Burkholderiaceae bacterium]
MATDAKKLQPIIIKRVKKGGHAVHGGAWKIAYADFVTAMMAFFLLMWLLGSTSEGDKKGLSDYFSAPLKVSMMGGSGAGASNSVIQGGGADLTKSSGQNARGEPNDPIARKAASDAARAELAKQDNRKLALLQDKISSLIANNPKLAEFKAQIRLEITPDGLQIQIVDDQSRPMFDVGSALVKVYMRDILREIGSALNGVENKISLDGHTDASPYGSGERGYSNWELSSDRANASRRELVAAGMPDDKLARVTGMASSYLLEPQNPLSPVNRRISILVMTREAEERLLGRARTPLDATTQTAAAPAIAASGATKR